MTTTATTWRRKLAPDDPRHGSTAGFNAGCNCTPCCSAKSAYEQTRVRRTAYGTWHPYTDAEPVRQHLRALGKEGLGWVRVARLAGVPKRTVSAILYGREAGKPTKLIRPHIAEKLLAIQAAPELIADRVSVPAVGTVRRLRALIALGYTAVDLAEHLPLNFQSVQRIACQNPEYVTNEVARATVALYDRLSLVVPADTWVHRRAKRTAIKRGWVPPLAWDDATIDDSEAQPDLGDTGGEQQHVDEVLVGQVLAGHAPLNRLNEAEEAALWWAWVAYRAEYGKDGPGLKDFARQHKTTVLNAERIRNAADGVTSRGKPRNTNTRAATGRTTERTAA